MRTRRPKPQRSEREPQIRRTWLLSPLFSPYQDCFENGIGVEISCDLIVLAQNQRLSIKIHTLTNWKYLMLRDFENSQNSTSFLLKNMEILGAIRDFSSLFMG